MSPATSSVRFDKHATSQVHNHSNGDHGGKKIPSPPPPPLPQPSLVALAIESASSWMMHHSMREAAAAMESLKINDIVGNGISGILHKWVNYGKGWRPRWFVLQDCVLSYYKLHGPDKITSRSLAGLIRDQCISRFGHRRIVHHSKSIINRGHDARDRVLCRYRVIVYALNNGGIGYLRKLFQYLRDIIWDRDESKVQAMAAFVIGLWLLDANNMTPSTRALLAHLNCTSLLSV
ncbi:hypothetical protein RJ639_025347, partial [Escallonia herrerae]